MSDDDLLLKIRDLKIDGKSGDKWHPDPQRASTSICASGEVLGVIGESGAGKSTIGLAAMGYTRGGCRISGGTVEFDGTDSGQAPECLPPQVARQAHRLCRAIGGGQLQPGASADRAIFRSAGRATA